MSKVVSIPVSLSCILQYGDASMYSIIPSLITIIVFTLFLLKTGYEHVKMFSMCVKTGKIVMINDGHDDIG